MKKVTLKTALFRGAKLKCPKCGQGRLLFNYLKQEKSCSHCHENLEDLRPDDGPAWLTILLTGHIIVPGLVTMEQYDGLSMWQETALIVLAALICIAFLLPRSKGIFIAIMWMLRQPKESKT
jgi:uncharacterized protein (DUF983 family)